MFYYFSTFVEMGLYYITLLSVMFRTLVITLSDDNCILLYSRIGYFCVKYRFELISTQIVYNLIK